MRLRRGVTHEWISVIDVTLSKPERYSFIDLFAGIGGMRLAFEYPDANWRTQESGAKVGRCVFTSEWDPHAQKTYFANFHDTPHGDITKIKSNKIPEFDILLGGFPCQPFSSIGLRQGFKHPTQGTLFDHIRRILKYHVERNSPRAFLLENVVGLKTHNGGDTLGVIEDTIKKLGFDYAYEVLNSVRFGVPQNRERIYIVGFRRNDGRPGKKLENLDWPLGDDEEVGIGQFLSRGVDGYSISKHLQDVYLFKENDGRPQVVNQNSDYAVKTLVASYHKIQRLTGTFVADGPTGMRLLTESECKAIMGFPATFEVPVSRTQMYRQFGNSVVVPVIQQLAKMIYSVLDNQGQT